MKTLDLAVVIFIFGCILLAVTYGFFASLASPRGLPVAFPYSLAYSLTALTTSFFVLAVIFLIISRKRKNPANARTTSSE